VPYMLDIPHNIRVYVMEVYSIMSWLASGLSFVQFYLHFQNGVFYVVSRAWKGSRVSWKTF